MTAECSSNTDQGIPYPIHKRNLNKLKMIQVTQSIIFTKTEVSNRKKSGKFQNI
jgi:hypothetical protein